MQLLLPLLPLSRQVPSHYLPILPMYLLSKLFRDEERRRKKKKKETTTKLKRKKKKKKEKVDYNINNKCGLPVSIVLPIKPTTWKW